ncbi:VOC family protein [Nocardia sp. NPDC048505]|uniref:VOC family protein n=1 Tax=unclassified Nocardia TaxID=2637762 RepID=UPI0033E3527A
MRIVKTYARLFVTDLDHSLPLYERIVGRAADLRFAFERAELAAVGDFLLIAGPPEHTDRYRATVGPVIVDDLGELITELAEAGAELIDGPHTSATGRFAYLRHPDGVTVEYVQWATEVRSRVLGRPA